MIVLKGDTHGSMCDLIEIQIKANLKETDTVIIAGDFGFIWDKTWRKNIETIEEIIPGNICFIDGNHENFDLLNEHGKQVDFAGSVSKKFGERTYWLQRGCLYKIEDKNIFTFGGAISYDKERRIENLSWWKEENPAEEEYALGERIFENNIYEIDYVITHDAPMSWVTYKYNINIDIEEFKIHRVFEEWYQKIYDKPKFKKWYFGHHHVEDTYDKLVAVYKTEYLL